MGYLQHDNTCIKSKWSNVLFCFSFNLSYYFALNLSNFKFQMIAINSWFKHISREKKLTCSANIYLWIWMLWICLIILLQRIQSNYFALNLSNYFPSNLFNYFAVNLFDYFALNLSNYFALNLSHYFALNLSNYFP